MAKGIAFGLLFQVVVATGFILIANVTSVKSDVLRASLMLCFGGVIALGIATYFFLSGTEHPSLLGNSDMRYLLIGAVLA